MADKPDYRTRRGHKIVGVAIGALFILMALVLLVFYEPSAGILYLLGVALFALLGIDQVRSVLAEKDSVLDRIGPLP